MRGYAQRIAHSTVTNKLDRSIRLGHTILNNYPMNHTVHSCIKHLRQEADLTQEALAKRVGTSRQTICSMEKGDYIPSLSLALLIAKQFKRPVEDVFTLKKKCNP